MYPHFLALFNKSGIACAADADQTVFRLTKNLPVAVAVNPASSIPWEKIINDYQLKSPVRERLSMTGYVADFEKFLASVPIKKGWENLPPEEMNIIFFGFGSQDIFPSVYDVLAEVKDGVLGFGQCIDRTVNSDNPVLCHLLGDFEGVSTLIWGATNKVRSFFLKKDQELFRIYAERVKAKFQGTKYEDYVNMRLAEYDADSDIAAGIDMATDKSYSSFMIGVDSFSVEDMVTAVESLVQANAELSLLKAGQKGTEADVKEIAVLTIPEGLTWIKHSLYYRRNEI